MNIIDAIKLSLKRRNGKSLKIRRKAGNLHLVLYGYPDDTWVNVRISDLTATDWVAIVPMRRKPTPTASSSASPRP